MAIAQQPNPKQRSDTKISRMRFCTTDFAREDRQDALVSFGKGLYSYKAIEHDGECPRLEVSAWAFSDVCVALVGHGPQREVTPKTLDPRFEDKACLRLTKTGRVHAASMDQSMELGPGSIALLHPQHELQKPQKGTGLSLRLPYRDLGYDPYCCEPIVELKRDRWQVRVLLSAIEALLETLPDMDVKNAPSVARQLISLVRAALDLEEQDEMGHAALKTNRAKAMRGYLIKNLSRPDLSISHLMSEFGASKATVYRAFEDVGGVTNFLNDQRFTSVFRDLRQTPANRGAVRHIAERNGFFDQTNFARMFRKRFGVRPSDVLGTSWCPGPENAEFGIDKAESAMSLASFWTTQTGTESVR